MSSIPIIKFMFAEEWSVLNDALSFAPNYESETYSAAGDLTTALGMAQAGLVIASLRDKNDLIQLATLIKMVKKLSPATFVKVIVVNFSGDKQFEKAVAKLGILDIVEARIQTKALRFKLDFMMKSVNVHLKKMANVQANTQVKSVEAAKAQEKKSSDHAPIWTDSLDNENDIWLLKNEADCKKVLTRWLIKMMGPSPYVAQWVESNNPGVWRFDFKSEMDIFITGNGSWFYKGDQKPDFIWAENSWSFAGSAFDLFYKEGTEVTSRVCLKDKQLTIAKNSDYAKTKEQNIIESFDKDLVFRKELGAKAESDSVDKDVEKYKNLEGKGKTDSLKQNPLAGKGSTSHLNTDPMSMDLNPGDNDLSSDPLSQKGSTSQQPGFMKGKNSPDAPDAGPLSQPTSQGINSGANLEMDNKNKHETYYKGHNEAEKFDAKDIGHAIKKDGVADNLKGKTSTDQMEGHLKSPDAKSAAPKDANPSEMGGKSFTDLLAGHLKSKNPKAVSPEAKKAEETNGKDSNFISNDDFEDSGMSDGPVNKTQSSSSSRQNKVIPLVPKSTVTREFIPLENPDQALEDSMQTAVVTSMLSQDLIRVVCKLDDHFDNTIIFTAGKSELSLDKPVNLNLNFNYMGKDSNLKFNAQITAVDVDDEGLQYITVEMSKENVSSFNSFMKLFGTRQQNIDYFLKAAKGY